jgi:hypothetical protein
MFLESLENPPSLISVSLIAGESIREEERFHSLGSQDVSAV